MKVLFAFFAMLLLQQVPSEEFTKEGRITLEKHDWRDQKQPTVITVGKEVTFAINAYIDDFMGKPIINANAKITNTTAANMHVIYFITFYDERNRVVGAYAMETKLKPQGHTNFGSALIHGTEADFARVTHYKLYTTAHETVSE